MTARESLVSLPASALGDPEQARRADRFRATRPRVILLARFTPPRALIDGAWHWAETLRALMDDLEELCPPDAAGYD